MVHRKRRNSVLQKTYRIADPFHIELDEYTHGKPNYIKNQIRTTKYTWINFFPICLLQEFRRVSFSFFLLFILLISIFV